jgi:hypothetical protein
VDLSRFAAQAIGMENPPSGRYAGLRAAKSRQRVHLMCDVLTAVVKGQRESDLREVFELRLRESPP